MPNIEHTRGHFPRSCEHLLMEEFTLSRPLIAITISCHDYLIIISKLLFPYSFFFKSIKFQFLLKYFQKKFHIFHYHEWKAGTACYKDNHKANHIMINTKQEQSLCPPYYLPVTSNTQTDCNLGMHPTVSVSQRGWQECFLEL